MAERIMAGLDPARRPRLFLVEGEGEDAVARLMDDGWWIEELDRRGAAMGEMLQVELRRFGTDEGRGLRVEGEASGPAAFGDRLVAELREPGVQEAFLVRLRLELYTARRVLEGEKAEEFWGLLGELETLRPPGMPREGGS